MGELIVRVEPRADRKKLCAVCGQWLEVDYFHRDRQHPDGRRNECSFCRAEYRRRGITADELRQELLELDASGYHPRKRKQ